MSDLILAIDQGTSATKACVFEPPGRLLGAASVPVARHYPEPGAVEQDPGELVESCRTAADGAVRDAGITGQDLAGCAVGNTGESFILFEGPGRPLTPVIGWQDSRCGQVLTELAAGNLAEEIPQLTGLPLHAEFTAPKLAHQLARLDGGAEVRFGTLDTWITACLDPSGPHVTDRATSSRTMLVGLADEDWNQTLLEAFGVSREILPGIRPCDAMGANLAIADTELPLLASGYDMGLAVLGHACLNAGETKATFGTCLGVMTATGDQPLRSEGLLTAIAYTRADRASFALDGEIAAAGSLVQWAADIGIAGSPSELEALALQATDSGGAVIVPAISGLGAPHWRDDVRGRIVGLTESIGRPQLARALLDAIAFPLREVIEAIRAGGLEVDLVRVDGGLSRSELLMQRCADVAGVPMLRSAHDEATALGAAALAMLGTGSASESEIADTVAAGASVVEPSGSPTEAELSTWQAALDEALAPA
jgi:glycerol kinase